ncbi:MAG: hypothetical protein WAV92_00930 [Halopseudomonas yangmingensis]|uniref:Uncharacterized protein n=1 Tax=Halopseudomonas yangmingensis TaxID=1720063 RepID=A0A1I4NHU8_9GAMM|nr:hypothetical protein [Halopseudomonas yangmingensis]SFM15068.1 hypothetical protein SAMN05216217_101334 [Halopseudomonas yangmingensis]
MAVTLHLTTLDGRQLQCHPQAMRQLLIHLDTLDAQCRSLGVTPVSEFIDLTDLEWQEVMDLAAADAEPPAIDPETGCGYAIEDMEWLSVGSGMVTFEALAAHLQHNPLAENTGSRDSLLKELQQCLEILAPLESLGLYFNLTARD